jgi:hypothetical protein
VLGAWCHDPPPLDVETPARRAGARALDTVPGSNKGRDYSEMRSGEMAAGPPARVGNVLDMFTCRPYLPRSVLEHPKEIVMDTEGEAGRLPSGRFAPGVSGNPAGRPRGRRNRRTIFEEALREGEALELVRGELDRARKANGGVSARFVLDRLEPARRGPRVAFDLADPSDVREAYYSVLMLLAEGEISGEEACAIGRFLRMHDEIPVYAPPEEEAFGEEGFVSEEEEFVEEEADMEAAIEAVSEPDRLAAEPGPQPAPPPLAGEGGGGTTPTGAEPGASPHPDPPPQAGEGECIASAATPPRSEEELRRLWHKGELTGRELIEFATRERRRLAEIRGFRTIQVPAGADVRLR